jgi:hypothetical protein
VFKWANDWNKFLPGVKFTGVVFDNEEFGGGAGGPLLTATNAAALKSKFAIKNIGLAVGFDGVGKFATMPWIDQFYMEMYDFYTPAAYIDASPQSRFVQYVNNPGPLVDYITNQVLSAGQLDLYRQYASKVHAMWSTQSLGTNCIYPLGTNCGINNEFGVWSAAGFTSFLSTVKAKSPIFASLAGHGLYEFDLIPTSWA